MTVKMIATRNCFQIDVIVSLRQSAFANRNLKKLLTCRLAVANTEMLKHITYDTYSMETYMLTDMLYLLSEASVHSTSEGNQLLDLIISIGFDGSSSICCLRHARD